MYNTLIEIGRPSTGPVEEGHLSILKQPPSGIYSTLTLPETIMEVLKPPSSRKNARPKGHPWVT